LIIERFAIPSVITYKYPTITPISKEAQDVIDAAVEWRRIGNGTNLMGAVEDYLASQKRN
jgi:hypothetical protein